MTGNMELTTDCMKVDNENHSTPYFRIWDVRFSAVFCMATVVLRVPQFGRINPPKPCIPAGPQKSKGLDVTRLNS